MDYPNAFIQWGSTEVCGDLRCDCGYTTHFDGFFQFSVTCENCKETWKLSTIIEVEKT